MQLSGFLGKKGKNVAAGANGNDEDWGDGADGVHESVEAKLTRLSAMLEGL